MTKILALDTSTDACSAAILLDNNVILERFVVSDKQHTNLILPMIEELLVKAQINLSDLDTIAFGCGPGSFTGIRLASSIVQGIAFLNDLPVIRISSLRALAQSVFEERGATKVCVAQDARMKEVYLGAYQLDKFGIMQNTRQDILIAPEEIDFIDNDDCIFVGNGWQAYKDVLIVRYPKVFNHNYNFDIYPRAKSVARLALVDFNQGLVVSAQDALPVYLRKEVAWIDSTKK